jgi:MFS family permease
MLLLDITIVNVALPSIERDLRADLADLQWVIDAHALTLAALLLTGGSPADRVGRRRVFLIGLVVDPRRSGMASGINSTFRQVGIATGIAAWGAIFQHVVRDEFVRDAARAGVRGAQGRGGEVADFIAFGGARRSGNPQLARLGEQAFVAGLNHLLLLAGLLAFLGALACALLVRPAAFRAAAGH